MNRNRFLFTEFLHKFLIPIALLTSQMKIAMCCLNTIAEILQDQQQRHTVCPTTQSHKMQSLTTQKSVLRDEISNFIQHIARVLSDTHPQGDRY